MGWFMGEEYPGWTDEELAAVWAEVEWEIGQEILAKLSEAEAKQKAAATKG